MTYDTRQDPPAQPRYDEPPRDESSPRDDAPGSERSEAPSEERHDAPSEERHDAPSEERSEAPSEERYEAPDEVRYDEPSDESSPRHEPPAWQHPEQASAAPSDLDAAEPDGAATPVDTPAPVAVGTAPAPVPPAPGEVTDDTTTLWPEDAVRDFQQRWREVQLRFVDDPRAAADEAQELVSEALGRFSETLNARKSELDGWQGTDGADTERMRTVVRRYRILLDRLLEL
jgi:hypothetical protein